LNINKIIGNEKFLKTEYAFRKNNFSNGLQMRKYIYQNIEKNGKINGNGNNSNGASISINKSNPTQINTNINLSTSIFINKMIQFFNIEILAEHEYRKLKLLNNQSTLLKDEERLQLELLQNQYIKNYNYNYNHNYNYNNRRYSWTNKVFFVDDKVLNEEEYIKFKELNQYHHMNPI
jgi:hypothetical protein